MLGCSSVQECPVSRIFLFAKWATSKSTARLSTKKNATRSVLGWGERAWVDGRIQCKNKLYNRMWEDQLNIIPENRDSAGY